MSDKVEIRKMISEGEVERAVAELETVLAVAPDDVEAKLLYGTCRQLLGDEAGFRRVHDELAPALDSREKNGERSCVIEAWRKYRQIFKYVASAGLVIGATTILCGCYGVPPANRNYRPEEHRGPSAEVGRSSQGRADAGKVQPAEKAPRGN